MKPRVVCVTSGERGDVCHRPTGSICRQMFALGGKETIFSSEILFLNDIQSSPAFDEQRNNP